MEGAVDTVVRDSAAAGKTPIHISVLPRQKLGKRRGLRFRGEGGAGRAESRVRPQPLPRQEPLREDSEPEKQRKRGVREGVPDNPGADGGDEPIGRRLRPRR